MAIDCEQSTLPCFVYDVTDDEALQVVIQRHRRSEGLNDYGRIVLALGLESYFRERRRPTGSTGQPRPSSKLTNHEHRDVRKDIAGEAGVSTGNLTKVKQLLETVIPEVREATPRERGQYPSGLAVAHAVRRAGSATRCGSICITEPSRRRSAGW